MKKDLRDGGRIILALGEVTGHVHEVVTVESETVPTLEQAQYFEVDGRRELIALVPCVLRHQEHAPVRLDPARPEMLRQGDVLLVPTGPGCWHVVQQQEWIGPEVWRAVED